MIWRLPEAGLTVKPSKIVLTHKQVSFFGHLVSGDSVWSRHQHTEALRNLPPPEENKGIVRFIGMANYFIHFVLNFTQLAAPLKELWRKGGSLFMWGHPGVSYQSIKSTMVLGVPNFERRFLVQADASNREVSAVLFDLVKFRFYLEHREFELETDNQAVCQLLAHLHKTGHIARWAVRISAFKCKV